MFTVESCVATKQFNENELITSLIRPVRNKIVDLYDKLIINFFFVVNRINED